MDSDLTSTPFLIFVLAALGFALLLVFRSVRIVPQASEWTVERFGRYTRTLNPGLHLVIPLVERIGQRISMQETVLDIPGQDVITRDNATVSADGVAFYQVIDAAKVAYEVKDMRQAITNLALTNIRSVIGGMTLDDVLSRRDDINEKLLRVIDLATNPWGVKVTRVEIKDLTPPADLTRAMNQQMMAERQKRAEILQAEGEKQAAILRAEGEKASLVLEAEGRRDAAFRDAEARERAAQAEGRATTMVSEAIASGDLNAINYFVAQRYTQALEAIASAENQKVIMVPLEASSLIGSLAGIVEVARSASGPPAPATPPAPAPQPGGGPWTGTAGEP